MSPPGSGSPSRHRRSYGPAVAALILTVTIFSFAGAWALDGIPDSETGLFWMMGAIAGMHLGGMEVVSRGWLLVARIAGIGMIISAVAIGITRKRIRQASRSA